MVQILYNIFGYFDVPMHLVLCERKKGQGKHNRFWNNAIFVHWKHVRDMELRCHMVEIQFVDGTSESIETYKDTTFQYDSDMQCFKAVEQDGKSFAIFPREFVKNIRYIDV